MATTQGLVRGGLRGLGTRGHTDRYSRNSKSLNTTTLLVAAYTAYPRYRTDEAQIWRYEAHRRDSWGRRLGAPRSLLSLFRGRMTKTSRKIPTLASPALRARAIGDVPYLRTYYVCMDGVRARQNEPKYVYPSTLGLGEDGIVPLGTHARQRTSAYSQVHTTRDTPTCRSCGLQNKI